MKALNLIAMSVGQAFGFTHSDATTITKDIYYQWQWVNFNDLKLQVFQYAQRLVNGGC